MRNSAGTDSIENLMFARTSSSWRYYEVLEFHMIFTLLHYVECILYIHTEHTLQFNYCIILCTRSPVSSTPHWLHLKLSKFGGQPFWMVQKERSITYITYRDEMEIHPRNFTTGLFSLELAQHVRILQLEQTNKIWWFQTGTRI